MTPWLAAMAVATTIALVLPSRLRHRAYRRGWFERSTDTNRPRSRRRPTHGGVVASLAVASGSLFAGIDEPACRAALAAAAVGLLVTRFADRSKGPRWLVPASRLITAIAVPVAGVEVDLTGTEHIDRALVAGITLLVIGGLAVLEHTDGAAPAVAGVAAIGLLVIGIEVDDPSLPVAAAIAGAALGLLVHAAAPAALRLGRSGAGVLGGSLVAAAFALEPASPAPTSLLVPILVLLLPALAAGAPSTAARLAARGLPTATTLTLAAGAGAGAVVALDRGALGAPAAVAIAVGAALAVLLVSLTVRRPVEAPAMGRLRWTVLGGGVALAVAAGLPAAWLGLQARADMYDGKEQAEAGLAAVEDGDLDAAVEAFTEADAAFDRASGSLSSPLLRLAGIVPGAAQNVAAARDLAEVGSELSASAVAVSDRARAEDLQVVDGRFPIEAAAEVGARLVAAREVLVDSAARLGDLPSPWLVPQVAAAVDAVTTAVDDTQTSIALLSEATRLAPQLLGAGGERRWFVAAMSSSELRGAGGLLGDAALVRAADGELDLETTLSAAELNAATDESVLAFGLSPVYRTVYPGWQAHRFWQNLTVTPDFPTVGSAVTTAAATGGLGTIDGVIGIDPIGIAALLEVTGPIRVDLWPEPIDATNAVQVLLFDNYNRLPPEQIDEFQGDVIEALVDALTSRTLPNVSAMSSALASSVAGGHLRFWSPALDEQHLFRLAGADGASVPARLEGATDHIELTTQNSSEAKIDWFLRRTLDYQVTNDTQVGLTTAVATVTLTNGAPGSGVAEYVIGGARGGPTRAGENRTSLTLRTSMNVVRVTDGAGNPVGVTTTTEGGLQLATVRTVLPPGGSATFVFEYVGALDTTDGFHLAIGRQPTAWPDTLTVGFAERHGGSDGQRSTQQLVSTEPVVVDLTPPDPPRR